MTIQQDQPPITSVSESGAAGALAAAGARGAVEDKRDLRNLVGPVLVFAAFVGFWYAAPYVFFSDRKFLIPPPHDVINIGFLQDMTFGQLWALVKMLIADIIPFWDFDPGIDDDIVFVKNMEALWLTTKVAIVGLFFAIVLGGLFAMVMSQAKWIENAFYPYLIALQAVPILALVPLIGSIWGFGFTARTIVCIIISIFPIVANTLFGLLSAQKGHHELFTLHGAGRMTRLRKLMIPAALPAVFTGLRIAAGLSVIGAIVGDFFFRRGDPGIGSLLDAYFARIQQEELFAAIILSALLGIAVFSFFGWLSKRVIGAWHTERGAT